MSSCLYYTLPMSYLNYPVSSKSRTLLLVLSLKILCPVISLPSYALSTGSEIAERIEYKILLLTYKVLATTQPLYFHNYIYLFAYLFLARLMGQYCFARWRL